MCYIFIKKKGDIPDFDRIDVDKIWEDANAGFGYVHIKGENVFYKKAIMKKEEVKKYFKKFKNTVKQEDTLVMHFRRTVSLPSRRIYTHPFVIVPPVSTPEEKEEALETIFSMPFQAYSHMPLFFFAGYFNYHSKNDSLPSSMTKEISYKRSNRVRKYKKDTISSHVDYMLDVISLIYMLPKHLFLPIVERTREKNKCVLVLPNGEMLVWGAWFKKHGFYCNNTPWEWEVLKWERLLKN